MLSALSGAWYWGNNYAKKPGGGTDGKLNDKALTIKWEASGVDPKTATEVDFNEISKGIGADLGDRWEFYHNIVGKTLVGGDPYEDLRAALQSLGMSTAGARGYQKQFGIMLKPSVVSIQGGDAKLLLASGGVSPHIEMSMKDPADPNGTATSSEAANGQNEETQMLTPSSKLVSGTVLAAVMAAAGAPSLQAEPVHAMGVCRVADGITKGTSSYGEIIMPGVNAATYMNFYHDNQDPLYKKYYTDSNGFDHAAYKLLTPPKHGRVILDPNAGPNISAEKAGWFYYVSDKGFDGEDHFVMQVKQDNLVVTIHYTIEVPAPDENPNGLCYREQWKISRIDLTGTDGTFLASTAFTPEHPFQPSASPISVANAGFALPGANVSFSDLAGSGIGQERNDNTATSITLDTNAAGYGWFVDFTPADNAEFLPTANTSEWIAKPGSAAAGKMDLYTVLLHEYGHALGLDHSPDSHDFMAATLKPGVRHVLSQSDLATLAKMADVPAPDPNAPLPPIPFDLSLMALAFMRKESATADNGPDGSGGPNGSGGPDPDAAGATEVHYDVVVNPELTNPEFNGTNGWNTEGQVTTSEGAATLSESSNSQTRLNQLFVVGPNDKYLRFTVSGLALDNPGDIPEDAFEAALLDANTGVSLLDPINLSRSDAILNLQADGRAFLSDKVQVIANSDDSHTYVVDLTGIAAGTAVNLSFDLLGFGQVQSQVTIRGLNIGAGEEQSVTQADTVTTAEDTPFTLDARVNDTNANLPGYVPVIVEVPAHGQVTVNSDGTFAYTPEANYNGADSFTYKLSNGSVDSNISAVDIPVTPI